MLAGPDVRYGHVARKLAGRRLRLFFHCQCSPNYNLIERAVSAAGAGWGAALVPRGGGDRPRGRPLPSRWPSRAGPRARTGPAPRLLPGGPAGGPAGGSGLRPAKQTGPRWPRRGRALACLGPPALPYVCLDFRGSRPQWPAAVLVLPHCAVAHLHTVGLWPLRAWWCPRHPPAGL